MRRCILALAALLIGTASESKANYIIIRVIVKQAVAEKDPNAPPMGGQNVGQPPGPGVFGNIGGPGPGFMGASGGPGPGFMGAMGKGPNVNPNAPKKRLNLNPSDFVTVVVPLKEWKIYNRKTQNLPDDVMVWSKWGRAMMFMDKVEVLYQPYNRANPLQMFVGRNNALKGAKRNPDELIKLAQWTLTVGLNDQCIQVMDEIVKMVDNSKADMNPRTAKAVAAYKTIKTELNRGTVKQSQANEWKERLSYPIVNSSEHYALLYNDDAVKDSVARRLKHLEYEFRAFYLWHALKGKALPFPDEKLLAVLVSGPDFHKYRSTFDADESVDDGFHARRENIAVFVGQRLDEGSRNFDALMKPIYREYNVEGLLKGEFFGVKLNETKKFHAVCRAQTLALADAALQEEGEIASATHEGARQLFLATGLLPKNVVIPEWLRFGTAAMFEHPKSPFPGDYGTVKSAFWSGVGGPSWAYMSYFAELEKTRRLSPVPVETLLNTITDEYFRLAHEGREAKRKLGNIPKQAAETLDLARQRALDRARALSWALTYYLASERFDDLQKYYQELATLPRDLELDDVASVRLFAKAFNLVKVGLERDEPDPAKLNGFAEEWLRWMRTQRSPIDEFKLDEVEAVDPNDPNGGFGPPPEGGTPGGTNPFPM